MNCYDRLKNPALLSLPINLSANPKRRNLHTFSRAFLQTIISFEFDWLIGLSLSFPIGQSNCFGFTFKNFALFTCRRLEYTRDQLLEFKKQIDNKGGQGQGEEQGGGFGGGFGGFGGGGGNEVS